MNNDYVFLYLARNKHFLKLCILSVRSLQKFSNFNILIIVDNKYEKTVDRYLSNVLIKIVK